MAGPEMSKIEIGNELDTAELSVISDLKLDAFDTDKNTENNMDELKTALKSTKINLITSAKDAATKTTEQKTLSDIAKDFATYIEKWEGRKLQLIEANKDKAPERIKYIVSEPKNNDLAFLVQKLAGLIEYQTALEYSNKEEYKIIKEVKNDKVFGNQTKRALAGLKTWIESDNTTPDKITFLGEKAITKLIKENTKEWKIDKTVLNTALNAYHLIFDDNNRVKPAEWYWFIDLNSNNYAVGKWIVSETKTVQEGDVTKKEGDATKKVEYDAYKNEIVSIDDISKLPLEKRTESKTYKITKDGNAYYFYGGWRVSGDEKNYDWTELIEKTKTNDWRKRKGEANEKEYDAIGKEMDAYIHSMNTDLGIMHRNDTNNMFSLSGNYWDEKYKETLKIDLKNKTISYLNKTLEFNKDMPYTEVFYTAYKSYELINKRSSSHGSFAFDTPTGLHFNYIKGTKPDLALDIITKNMPTISENNNFKAAWVKFLNDCQDVI